LKKFALSINCATSIDTLTSGGNGKLKYVKDHYLKRFSQQH
jgi:hypothetical protein